MSKRDQMAALEARLAALESERFMANHEHIWRYRKSVTCYPKGSFQGTRHVFYDWECTDEHCTSGSSGTNDPSRLPAHFPAELR